MARSIVPWSALTARRCAHEGTTVCVCVCMPGMLLTAFRVGAKQVDEREELAVETQDEFG